MICQLNVLAYQFYSGTYSGHFNLKFIIHSYLVIMRTPRHSESQEDVGDFFD